MSLFVPKSLSCIPVNSTPTGLGLTSVPRIVPCVTLRCIITVGL